MNNLLDILKKLRQQYPGFGSRMHEVEALGRWAAAVGPAIAKHTRALCVKDRVLWVEVDHPIWRSELHYRKRQILQLLNEGRGEKLGPAREALEDLFFVDPRKDR